MSKNIKFKQFNSISKKANFRVLQFYPLKMNLVLEIRKIVIKDTGIHTTIGSTTLSRVVPSS